MRDVTSLYDRRADDRWNRLSVGDIFERYAITSPDAEALVGAPGAYSHESYSRLTYAQADGLANAVANGLIAAGVRRGDRVMLICGNSVEAFIAKIAVAKASGVAVPVNPGQSADVVADAVRLTEPVFVFADDEYEELTSACAPHGLAVDVTIPIHGAVRPGTAAFHDFARQQSRHSPDTTVHGDDIWEILFTSGTTAMPKGTMLSHTYAYLSALGWALSYTRGLRHESFLRLAAFLPTTFHVSDQGYAMAAHCTGGCLIIGRRFDPTQIAATLAAERATAVMAGSVEMVRALLPALGEVGADGLSAMTCVVFGLGSMPQATADRLEALMPGVTMLTIAGQTETVIGHRFPANAFPAKYAEAQAERRNIVGKPSPLLAARVAAPGDTAEPLSRGATGELVYRSPVMMAGYYRDPLATKSAFAGGWFHSGDLAWEDADGFRYITGRIKEIIKTGGENVSCLRVEGVLQEHPTVEEVAVIGLPDQRWGEAVTAVVVVANGVDTDPAAIEAELIAFARSRLAGHETPKRVVFATALPRDFSGKLRRFRLREQYAAQVPQNQAI